MFCECLPEWECVQVCVSVRGVRKHVYACKSEKVCLFVREDEYAGVYVCE